MHLGARQRSPGRRREKLLDSKRDLRERATIDFDFNSGNSVPGVEVWTNFCDKEYSVLVTACVERHLAFGRTPRRLGPRSAVVAGQLTEERLQSSEESR